MQSLDVSDVNCYFFTKPLSPHLASEIDIAYIKYFINSKVDPYVELAGGLMVPLSRSYTQLDLIKSFKDSKVDLVIGNKLGCINHALLTLDVLKANEIELQNVYINDMGVPKTSMMDDNEKVIMDYI